MPCESFQSGSQSLLNGQFFEAVFCVFWEPMGSAFVLLVFGAIALGSSIYGRPVIPIVLALLLSPVVLEFAPGIAIQWAGVIAVMFVFSGGFQLVRRTRMR